jgi:hypothetical protein
MCVVNAGANLALGQRQPRQAAAGRRLVESVRLELVRSFGVAYLGGAFAALAEPGRPSPIVTGAGDLPFDVSGNGSQRTATDFAWPVEQDVVFFIVDGAAFPTSREEAARVVRELRLQGAPAAAVYVERLIDELEADPAMADTEAAQLALALHELAHRDGSLSDRLEALRLALVRHFRFR